MPSLIHLKNCCILSQLSVKQPTDSHPKGKNAQGSAGNALCNREANNFSPAESCASPCPLPSSHQASLVQGKPSIAPCVGVSLQSPRPALVLCTSVFGGVVSFGLFYVRESLGYRTCRVRRRMSLRMLVYWYKGANRVFVSLRTCLCLQAPNDSYPSIQ